MVAYERKRRSIMIEPAPRPCCSLVARSAILAVLTFVDILCGVAGVAILRSILLYPFDMASLAFDIDVRTRQNEPGRTVVELSR